MLVLEAGKAVSEFVQDPCGPVWVDAAESFPALDVQPHVAEVIPGQDHGSG